MEHNQVNEELLQPEDNQSENNANVENTTVDDLTPSEAEVSAVVENPTPEADAPVAVEEEVEVEIASPQVEIPSNDTEVTSETETSSVVAETVTTGVMSENEVLNQVNNLLQDGKATDYIPRAEVQELLLFMDQLSKNLTQENYPQFVGLAKQIKDNFDTREKAGAVTSEHTQRFSEYFGKFNKRKSEFQRKNEEQNTTRKRELVQQLKDLIESNNLNHLTVKEIQTEWKTLRFISKEERENLDNSYKVLLDKYYAKKAQEQELLDYDRKRNLDKKNEIITKIRAMLPSEEDATKSEVWTEKGKALADLQKEWKETGHVPKEDMERINLEYKDVVENFYSQRREFFESQEQGMQENADKKHALLEQMKPYTEFTSTKPKEWEEATKKFLAIQEEWKAVGKAPIEKNGELWKQYREMGNAFFGKKTEFFKSFDEERNKNLEVRERLVASAEALKDSTEWDTAAREIQKLQEEWKTSGAVPDKFASKLWNRFREACDVFFTNRREANKGVRETEEKNLESKKTLVARVKGLVGLVEDREMVLSTIKEIQEEWKTIGKVPIKQKDTIWDEFKLAQDELFQLLRDTRKTTAGGDEERKERRERSGDGGNRGGDHNRSGGRDRNAGGGGNKPNKQRSFEGGSNRYEHREERTSSGVDSRILALRKRIQKAQEVVDQYGTNILYIARGKSGDVLRAQIQIEIDNGMAEIADYKKQIKDIEKSIKDEKAKVEAANAPVVEDTVVETPSAEVEETTNEENTEA